ncbi:hypothetical protein AQUCO_00400208v1 [Aquilegia coerulea]|uniref:Uncharacterized protein n=1 Tax=Aquilegia coerulea TaxID=218851 RepID=A0A2G5EU54_AQUCA|nr:hypothetical protein AQUCO_00400208v1 [Aquilegia coerulea]
MLRMLSLLGLVYKSFSYGSFMNALPLEFVLLGYYRAFDGFGCFVCVLKFGCSGLLSSCLSKLNWMLNYTLWM